MGYASVLTHSEGRKFATAPLSLNPHGIKSGEDISAQRSERIGIGGTTQNVPGSSVIVVGNKIPRAVAAIMANIKRLVACGSRCLEDFRLGIGVINATRLTGSSGNFVERCLSIGAEIHHRCDK